MNALFETNRRTVSSKIVKASAKALPPSSSTTTTKTTAAVAADRLVELKPYVAHMLRKSGIQPRRTGATVWRAMKIVECQITKTEQATGKFNWFKITLFTTRMHGCVCVRALAHSRARSRVCVTVHVWVYFACLA